MDLNEVLHRRCLCRCQSKYGTDKNYIHSYIDEFYNPLFKVIEPPKKLLEVGLARGASLLLWQETFSSAKLTGIDINASTDMHPDFYTLLNNENVKIIIGDAYAPSLFPLDYFDLIIDDGPHTLLSQISALSFIKNLSAAGLLIIEDVPQVARRLSILKSKLPEADREFIGAVSFYHNSGRYDDSIIYFTRDRQVLSWLEKHYSGLQGYYSKNISVWVFVRSFHLFIRTYRKIFGRAKRESH